MNSIKQYVNNTTVEQFLSDIQTTNGLNLTDEEWNDSVIVLGEEVDNNQLKLVDVQTILNDNVLTAIQKVVHLR